MGDCSLPIALGHNGTRQCWQGKSPAKSGQTTRPLSDNTLEPFAASPIFLPGSVGLGNRLQSVDELHSTSPTLPSHTLLPVENSVGNKADRKETPAMGLSIMATPLR